jgi:uncharacterized membrane protein YjjB (DUF3815 family)
MSLWAGVAVLGFALVFAVPRKTLPAILVLAVGAHLTRSIVQELGASLPVASFAAALLIGLTAVVAAPRTHQAKPIYTFAPVIPLVPGTFMFTTLTGLLQLAGGSLQDPAEVVDSVVVNGSTATLTVLALAVGAIGPTLVFGSHVAEVTPDSREPEPTQER